ncbi:MAG: hypothetical protein COB02_09640 [Candidatus Cloacimonadota bacterium]|nr:MAG: hypothetical protein COB02_09640 [Candidatus Cloacimonadota bacterium]
MKKKSILLVFIVSIFFVGCDSSPKKKIEISQKNHTLAIESSLKKQIEPELITPKTREKKETISKLIFKIKPKNVDIYNQKGVKIGNSNGNGVFEIDVPYYSTNFYFFKKNGYSKTNLKVMADSQMVISYVRLNQLNPTLKLAESGDSNAQLLVADMYFEATNGFNYDLKSANYFYYQSAKAGNIDAKARLCAMLNQHESLDYFHESIKHCQEAAKQNKPTALYFLGVMYSHGRTFKVDITKAKDYLQKASKLGLEEADEELKLLQ